MGESDIHTNMSQQFDKILAEIKKMKLILENLSKNMANHGDLEIVSSYLRFWTANQLLAEAEQVNEKIAKTKGQQNIHIFFNCDGEKTTQSMNILHNNISYDDTLSGRKQLYERIVQEVKSEKIFVASEQFQLVKQAIFKGKPSDASRFLKYGRVVTISLMR